MQNRKRTAVKIGLVCFIVMLPFAIWLTFVKLFAAYIPVGYTEVDAIRLQPLLKEYIQDHNGTFPESEHELIDKGYIRKDQSTYYSRPNHFSAIFSGKRPTS